MCRLACSFLQALPRPPAPFAGSAFRGVIQESSHTHSLISTWRGLSLRSGSSRPHGTTRAGSQEPTENDTSGHSSLWGHEAAGQEGCCSGKFIIWIHIQSVALTGLDHRWFSVPRVALPLRQPVLVSVSEHSHYNC